MKLPSNLRLKTSSIHNKGIFAREDIKKGSKVIEYVGEKITKAEADRRADKVLKASQKNKAKGAVYIFELNKKWDIDGDVSWNPARYINHSCDPNCETDIEGGHIWITAIKNIKKGDELSYNYGYDIEDAEDHKCLCGSKKCVGYIVDEDDWPKLKKLIKSGKLPKPTWAK